jgi:hypothetical protein
MNSSQNDYILNLTTKTWSRDSHGLYDYENNNMKISNFSITNNSKVIRKKNEIKIQPSNYLIQADETELLKVVKNGSYFVSNAIIYGMVPSEENIIKLQDKLWYVIKSVDYGNNQANAQNVKNVNEVVVIFNDSMTSN